MKNGLILGWIVFSVFFVLVWVSYPGSSIPIFIGWTTLSAPFIIACMQGGNASGRENPRMIVGEPPDHWPIRKWLWSRPVMGKKARSWQLSGPRSRYNPRRVEPRYGSGYFYRKIKFATYGAEYQAPNA